MDNRWNKLLKGDFELPTWLAVFILVSALLVAGGYYGFKKYKIYQSAKSEKEKTTENLLLTQQQELASAKQEIEALKGGQTGAKKAEDILADEPDSRLASIVKEWRPRTAYIKCIYDNDPDNPDEGSGLWLSSNNVILTSRHVVERKETVDRLLKPDSCRVKLPGDKEIIVKESAIRPWKNQEGVSAISISNPTSLMESTHSSLISACARQAAVGEKLIILGYPSIGSEVDITVTEGIISGYDENDGSNFYITSAKIDRGHSGGVAVSAQKNCYLGMPVFVRAGEVESLGRILDSRSL